MIPSVIRPGFFEEMPGLLKGTIQTTIWDPDNTVAANILHVGQNWQVRFQWTLTGPAIPILGGHFDLVVTRETLGAGPEGTTATLSVPVTAGVFTAPNTLSYDVFVNVPPIVTEGVYAISKHLHFTGTFGGTTAAFVEHEDVQFFQ